MPCTPWGCAPSSTWSARRRGERALGREDDLADVIAGKHHLEALPGVGERHRGVDRGGDVALQAQADRRRRAASALGAWIAGVMLRARQKRISRCSSSRVPIVEPTTSSWRKKTRLSSAEGAWPEVAPETTSLPPGLRERT